MGTAEVPLDYGHPSGSRMGLAVARYGAERPGGPAPTLLG
jgi:hypothetical protein